ncbi:MAG: type II secretion system protein [Candidatus Riflebacteria bacterium]|nr:type II secretion system protein [Candidatus Riflebacteria bacterium]
MRKFSEKEAFSLVETLVAVLLVSILTIIAVSYHRNEQEKAKIEVYRYNLGLIKEAMTRHFKSRMSYPRKVSDLDAYLITNPKHMLDISSNKLQVLRLTDDSSPEGREGWIYAWEDYDWQYDLLPDSGSHLKEFKDIRLVYQGLTLYTD